MASQGNEKLKVTAQKSPLMHQAYQQLKQFIEQKKEGVFPPIRDLAEQFSVSSGVMRKTLVALQQEGLVQLVHGRRTRFGSSPSRPQAMSSAAAIPSVRERLMESLINGHWRPGCELPKTQVLIRKFRCSTQSLQTALKLLENEKLVHKSGRRWVAGAKPLLIQNSGSKQRQVIIFMEKEQDWSWLHTNRTRDLPMELRRELNHAGVSMTPFLLEDKKVLPWGAYPSGVASLHRFLRQHTESLLGGILLVRGPVGSEWDGVLQSCLRYNMRCSWLDPNGKLTPKSHPKKRSIHCIFEERAALKLALQELRNQGHRHIGYLNSGYHSFGLQRGELLLSVAENEFSDLQIHMYSHPLQNIGENQGQDHGYPVSEKDRRLKQSSLENECMRTISNKESVSGKEKSSWFDGLKFLNPWIASYLCNSSITAWVIPNDRAAEHLYFWSRFVKVRIPKEISIVSFDNHHRNQFVPFSTIDFGFGNLGYDLAHWLLQDLPIKNPKNRVVGTRPVLIDRGSIAPPRNHSRPLFRPIAS